MGDSINNGQGSLTCISEVKVIDLVRFNWVITLDFLDEKLLLCMVVNTIFLGVALPCMLIE